MLEALYFLAICLICVAIWLFSTPLAASLKGFGDWWALQNKLQQYMANPLIFAYFGNLIGAVVTMQLLLRKDGTPPNLSNFVGHAVNLVVAVVSSWIVLITMLDFAFGTLSKAID
jgi:hypothetical protein